MPTPDVWNRKRYRNAEARQRAYFDTLRCSTYDLCCHKHKDMMHAENCPILAADLEMVAAEIRAIEADASGMVLQQYIYASRMRTTDRMFGLGVPCWMH